MAIVPAASAAQTPWESALTANDSKNGNQPIRRPDLTVNSMVIDNVFGNIAFKNLPVVQMATGGTGGGTNIPWSGLVYTHPTDIKYPAFVFSGYSGVFGTSENSAFVGLPSGSNYVLRLTNTAVGEVQNKAIGCFVTRNWVDDITYMPLQVTGVQAEVKDSVTIIIRNLSANAIAAGGQGQTPLAASTAHSFFFECIVWIIDAGST